MKAVILTLLLTTLPKIHAAENPPCRKSTPPKMQDGQRGDLEPATIGERMQPRKRFMPSGNRGFRAPALEQWAEPVPASFAPAPGREKRWLVSQIPAAPPL